MQVSAEVHVGTPFITLAAEIRKGMKGGSGPINKVFKRWAFRYRTFITQRFDRFSGGGGSWPPKIGGGPILRETNTLFNAIQPVFSGASGQLEERKGRSIRVGYGGPGKHPKFAGSVATLAEIHQRGLGNVPARKIIVPPSRAVIQGMKQDLKAGINELIKS